MKIKNFSNVLRTFSINLVGSLFLAIVVNAETSKIPVFNQKIINRSYLESKNQLEDYILDTGDELNIRFIGTPELSGLFIIDEQGEIFLDRIKYTYIRGLTINELTQLLEERYSEFLLNPEIYIRINKFKPIRISVRGEVRKPGLIRISSFQPSGAIENRTLLGSNINKSGFKNNSESLAISPDEAMNRNDLINYNSLVRDDNYYITTLSNAIKKAGGLTSYSNIDKLEITRDIPIGKGGGKKRAIINFSSFIQNAENSNDIRLFDGDDIFIPRLKEQNSSIIPESIIAGLSPRFITVSIAGQIENPGTVKIPIEGSLSDVMNLSGPTKPLSGKIYLIRYNNDGSLIRKNIKYSANSIPGSPQNPYLFKEDLIVVKNSILGTARNSLSAITDPFIGIYTTKEFINQISN